MKRICIPTIALMGLVILPAPAQQEAASDAGAPLLERDSFTGDWFGVRPFFSDRGLEFFATYSAELWGNTRGGIKTGTLYTGLLEFGAELDLEQAVGWKGATIGTTWLWLSGRDASEDLAGNFLTVSNIAGFNTLRMLDLWIQQILWDELLSVKAGQFGADSEFFISDYAGLFLNSTFGWPPVASMNIPSGGPAFPIGPPGIRLAASPLPWLTVRTAAFQGNVFAQDVNRHGFRYRLNAQTGFTFFNEIETHWNRAEVETGLPGTFKAGAWFQSGQLADPLADSTASGNSGYYFIIDQMVFRESNLSAPQPSAGGKAVVPSGKSAKSLEAPIGNDPNDQGLGWFVRMAFTPRDRNVVNYYFDTGFTYKGLIPTRDNDTLGIGFGYAQLSNGALAASAADGAFVSRSEMVLELTYQAELTPWLIFQPDLQLLLNPGGNPDALLLGGRATIVF